MKPNHKTKLGITLAGVLALTLTAAHADSFGSGLNTFTIDFVNIGNAGNEDDIEAAPRGGGVGYGYRMGTYEISQEAIDKATAGGLLNVTAGTFTGNEPAADMTWYEAAAFVNWLNTSTEHQAAYQIDAGVTALTLWDPGDAWDNDPGAGVELNLYRHKNAYYFLPSEDEWYKAAYHKNNGVTGNYWEYATGSDTAPTAVTSGTGAGTAVYDGVTLFLAAVNNNGGLSPYGTMGQNGNVEEWTESAGDGTNDSSSEIRGVRGGNWMLNEFYMSALWLNGWEPSVSDWNLGFRVASVPEPSCAVLMLGSGLVLLARRRRRAAV